MYEFICNKRTILAFVIIVFGFCAPFISNGKVPSILFFWWGFLLLLKSLPNKHKDDWASCAKLGVLVHIAGVFFLYLINFILLIYGAVVLIDLLQIFRWLFLPFSSLYESFFQPSQHRSLENEIITLVSYYSAIIADFVNVLLFGVLGIVFGNKRKKSQET